MEEFSIVLTEEHLDKAIGERMRCWGGNIPFPTTCRCFVAQGLREQFAEFLACSYTGVVAKSDAGYYVCTDKRLMSRLTTTFDSGEYHFIRSELNEHGGYITLDFVRAD